MSSFSKVKPILYSFWISSCSWRVRIALHLKNVEYEYRAVDLVEKEQYTEEYEKVSPNHQVPALKIGDAIITQSLPIVEYLNEVYPSNPLLPSDPLMRAKTRGLAEMINSGIQPLQNMPNIQYFNDATGTKDSLEMPKHFITVGFQALEKALEQTSGTYCMGDEVTIADVCLVPQAFNARVRYDIDLSQFPIIERINEKLLKLPAFSETHPKQQPDCP